LAQEFAREQDIVSIIRSLAVLVIAASCIALFVRAPAAASSPPNSAAEPAQPDGQALFKEWCAVCHSAGAYQAGTAGLQAKYKGSVPAELERRTDLNYEYVKTVVRKGVNVMPQFRKTQLTDAQLDALARYLSHTGQSG
jgi:(+)-pinoresinol hydroxylase